MFAAAAAELEHARPVEGNEFKIPMAQGVMVSVLAELAGLAEDDDRRREVFGQILASLALDLPVLPLVYPISAAAVGARVQAYPTSPLLDEHYSSIRLSAD